MESGLSRLALGLALLALVCAVAGLHARHKAGEIDQDTFRTESAPHATAIAALAHERERDGVISLVRLALANADVTEAIAVGAAHFFRQHAAKAKGVADAGQ